jgi:hypothetical protein
MFSFNNQEKIYYKTLILMSKKTYLRSRLSIVVITVLAQAREKLRCLFGAKDFSFERERLQFNFRGAY